MTQKEHDELADFAEKYFKKVFGNIAKHCQKESIEFFYDAYAKNTDDIYKAIVHEIHQEQRRTAGSLQMKVLVEKSYEKKCNRCKKVLDSSLFYEHYRKEFYYKWYSYCCKKCYIEIGKDKWANDENYRNNQIQKRKERMLKNPLKYKYSKEKTRAYYYNNIEKCKEKNKNWRANNIEKVKKYNKNWDENNKEKRANQYKEKVKNSIKWWDLLDEFTKKILIGRYGMNTLCKGELIKTYLNENN